MANYVSVVECIPLTILPSETATVRGSSAILAQALTWTYANVVFVYLPVPRSTDAFSCVIDRLHA